MFKKYIGDRSFYRRLFRIMLPVLVQNVITNFVSLLDNIMVGRVGTEPMSGVAIVNQLLFVFNLCVFGGLAGPGIFTAQFHGKGDDEGVRQTFRAKVWIAAGAFLAFGTVFVLFGEELISLFIHEGTENLDLAATLMHGKAYLKIMLFQMPLFALLNVYSSTLRETGETRLPMRAGIVAVFVNLCFNYLLIYGKFGFPKLGVEGAAVATVIARVVEVGIVVVAAHSRSKEITFTDGVWSTLKVPSVLVRKIFVMGAPLLLNEFLWSGGMTVMNQTLSLRGLEVVSAENIATTVSNLFFCAFFAMGTTVSIVVGQHLGAGRLEEAVDEDRKLIAFSVALCMLVGVVMVIIAPVVPRIYNTTDTVKHIASSMLIVSACMMPSNAFTNTCFFTLRSGGRSWITFAFDSLFVWVISIPGTLILVYLTSLPIIPVYAISYALDIIKCILGFILVRSRSWVNNLVSDI